MTLGSLSLKVESASPVYSLSSPKRDIYKDYTEYWLTLDNFSLGENAMQFITVFVLTIEND